MDSSIKSLHDARYYAELAEGRSADQLSWRDLATMHASVAQAEALAEIAYSLRQIAESGEVQSASMERIVGVMLEAVPVERVP